MTFSSFYLPNRVTPVTETSSLKKNLDCVIQQQDTRLCWKTCTSERHAGQGQTCQATSNFCAASTCVTLYSVGPEELLLLKYSGDLEGQSKIFTNWDASFLCLNSAMAPGTGSPNPCTCHLPPRARLRSHSSNWELGASLKRTLAQTLLQSSPFANRTPDVYQLCQENRRGAPVGQGGRREAGSHVRRPGRATNRSERVREKCLPCTVPSNPHKIPPRQELSLLRSRDEETEPEGD